MKLNTQKNFIMQLGALIALYASITSILILIFSVTNLKFPDEVAGYFESEGSRQAVRSSIAILFVFFPTYLVFTRLSNQDRRKHSNGEYATFAKWLVYLSLLGGILILLGDLVTLINYFLNGGITTRFLVKVFALFVIVGGTLYYYVLDVRGYFKKRVVTALYFALASTTLVVVALFYGYSYIETPSEVREIRLDEQQVTDLQDIYWRTDEYYRTNAVIPVSIDSLYINQNPPQAPTGREAYQFKVVNDTTFELCATFAAASPDSTRTAVKPIIIESERLIYENQNWEHTAGETCFVRILQK